jgi:hypothetical protein
MRRVHRNSRQDLPDGQQSGAGRAHEGERSAQGKNAFLRDPPDLSDGWRRKSRPSTICDKTNVVCILTNLIHWIGHG